MVFWAGYFFMDVRDYTLAQWSAVLFALLTLEIVGGIERRLVDGSGGAQPHVRDRRRGWGPGFGLAGIPSVLAVPIVYISLGFFVGLISTWLFVYIPEIFPTERRGTCVGWVMSLARVAYVVGPALAALLLRNFPTMEGFWVVAGLVMLIPTGIILFSRPFETRALELEEIAERALSVTPPPAQYPSRKRLWPMV